MDPSPERRGRPWRLVLVACALIMLPAGGLVWLRWGDLRRAWIRREIAADEWFMLSPVPLYLGRENPYRDVVQDMCHERREWVWIELADGDALVFVAETTGWGYMLPPRHSGSGFAFDSRMSTDPHGGVPPEPPRFVTPPEDAGGWTIAWPDGSGGYRVVTVREAGGADRVEAFERRMEPEEAARLYQAGQPAE